MKKMYLSLCWLFAIAISLTSCHKEKTSANTDSSTYYIKCKIDGTERLFATNLTARIMSYGAGMSGSSLNLIGIADATSSEGINLGINFSSGVPAVGTYQEDDSNNEYVIGCAYNPGSATIVYGAGTTSHPILPLNITITQMSNKEVSGTFKGAFYKTDVSTGEISTTEHVTLTEGTFKLPIAQL